MDKEGGWVQEGDFGPEGERVGGEISGERVEGKSRNQ